MQNKVGGGFGYETRCFLSYNPELIQKIFLPSNIFAKKSRTPSDDFITAAEWPGNIPILPVLPSNCSPRG